MAVIKDATVEEAEEPMAEYDVDVEHPRLGEKSVEENTVTPTETVDIPAATITLQDLTKNRTLPSLTRWGEHTKYVMAGDTRYGK